MLEKVIKQLSQEKFNAIADELTSAKGEKFVALLNKYRNDSENDEAFMNELGLNASSFYALRSRLFDKIRLFLFQDSKYEETEILKNVHAIPFILLNYPRETSVAILSHLENELIRTDMQSHLINVYSALKKLHINSEKYYYYEQSYNKTVAYTLAQDKAEELLLLFCKTLSSYILSGIESVKEVLILYIREIHNQTLLYDSGWLSLYHKIAYLNYVVFVDGNFSQYYSDKSTEELLKECQDCIAKFGKTGYKYNVEMGIRFLSYHYFYRLKLYKNIQDITEQFTQQPIELFNLYSITTPGIFLITLLEKTIQEKLPIQNLKRYILSLPVPEPDDEVMHIYYHISLAAVHYECDDISDCDQALQKLINFNFLKKYPRTETELKLFYIFILLLNEKSDLAENLIRSIARKNINDNSSEQSLQFISLLKLCLVNNSSTKQKKIFEAFKLYKLLSSTDNTFLSYIQIKEKHILQLSMI